MGKSRILFVDDEPTICGEMSILLNRKGYSVETANNGYDALAMFKKDPPDLVISDYRMPGLSGIDLLKHLKKIRPEIPFIMISGQGDVKVAVEALKEEAFDYQEKPVNIENLLGNIESALDKKKANEKGNELQLLGALSHSYVSDNPRISHLIAYRALDEYSKTKILQAFYKLLDGGTLSNKVILSLKQVTYINNVGLNTLVEINQKMKERGHTFVMAELADSVITYLKYLGYYDYFHVSPNLKDAIERVEEGLS